MTTVAWDGKYIAIDRQSTADGTKRLATKCRVAKGGALGSRPTVFAWAGCGCHGIALADWYEGGADPEKWPVFQHEGDDAATLIVANAEGVKLYFPGHQPAPEIYTLDRAPGAWGSGHKFALAAMACGKDARDAVRIAGRFDIYTSTEIDWFEL